VAVSSGLTVYLNLIILAVLTYTIFKYCKNFILCKDLLQSKKSVSSIEKFSILFFYFYLKKYFFLPERWSTSSAWNSRQQIRTSSFRDFQGNEKTEQETGLQFSKVQRKNLPGNVSFNLYHTHRYTQVENPEERVAQIFAKIPGKGPGVKAFRTKLPFGFIEF
jgi:hypothetical protein